MTRGSKTSGKSTDDKTVVSRSAVADALSLSRIRPAYQQVTDQLLQRILSGSLAAGDRLPSEAELASAFGVSRSTIREALRALASRDVIRTTRGTTGGTFVARVQLDQVSEYLETSIGLLSGTDVSVADMLEARELLEVPAARLAAHRRNRQHLAALREAIDREIMSRGRGGEFREHRNFHGLVVKATGNGLLAVMTEPVFRVLQARFLDPDVPHEFWGQVDHDHEAILRAIDDGDGDAAARAMSEHLVRLRQAYRDNRPVGLLLDRTGFSARTRR
ncbi:FadR/GntR family transcriptional regulator [Saccharopolyspora pogona]|uniref:FadR/GntR family transcriptional regulator n=1 Tax=Saccharopolyspora pogona TaxID=333966 RepID=UPI00168214D6|nr:FCD domain-containing protein [Saccharopolyspora pogona]